jgi:uncharacterized protein YndB with AHSA1/START domain
MARSVISQTTEINAPPEAVWRVFTDPAVTRQLGGEYVSDWQVGSPFGFKGLDGQLLTNGTILQIEPGKRLQHQLFNSVGMIDSVITYELEGHENHTTLHSREEFAHAISDEEYTASVEGWDAALMAVKTLAEQLSTKS